MGYYHIFNKPPGTRTVLPIGLTAAATTLVLNHAEPPADRAGGAMTGMILMPILGFLVWLIGFRVWRAIKPAKAPARGG